MSDFNVTIHESVKDYYTQRIEASASCCDDECGCGTYEDVVLDNLPVGHHQSILWLRRPCDHC